MLFVDDLPVVFIFQRILPELECNLFFQFRDEPVFHGGVAEDVVGSHAGLAAVYKFSEDDAPGLSTMQGLLPPSSRVTGVRCSAACRMTSLPTVLLPVKKM